MKKHTTTLQQLMKYPNTEPKPVTQYECNELTSIKEQIFSKHLTQYKNFWLKKIILPKDTFFLFAFFLVGGGAVGCTFQEHIWKVIFKNLSQMDKKFQTNILL